MKLYLLGSGEKQQSPLLSILNGISHKAPIKPKLRDITLLSVKIYLADSLYPEYGICHKQGHFAKNYTKIQTGELIHATKFAHFTFLYLFELHTD